MFAHLLRYGLIACLIVIGLTAESARADDSKEYLVKAAFIYNFVKFVEWPGAKAIPSQSSIDICVLGNSGIGQASSVFKQASTPKLALSLVEEKNAEKVADHCHIVVIGGSEDARLSSILQTLKGKPVLTVSDMDRFADRGGMIGFVVQDNKIKLVVNTRAADDSGMRIDAQLLEIALKVIGR